MAGRTRSAKDGCGGCGGTPRSASIRISLVPTYSGPPLRGPLSFRPWRTIPVPLFFFLFTLCPSLVTLACGDTSKCEGTEGGFPALEIVNPTDCDLNVMVDVGRPIYVPAKGTRCESELADTPLTGDHTVQSVKNKTGEICETRSVDFGSTPSDTAARGPLVTYQPSLANCVCDSAGGAGVRPLGLKQ